MNTLRLAQQQRRQTQRRGRIDRTGPTTEKTDAEERQDRSDWPNNREDRRRGEAGSIGLAQQQRRQNETPDERQARLEAVRLAQQKRSDISIATPLFQQNAVESRILNSHSKLTSLEFRECTLVHAYSHHYVFLNQHDLRMLISSCCTCVYSLRSPHKCFAFS